MEQEEAKQIFGRLVRTRVSEALIADAVDIYAQKHIADDAEREAFIDAYSTDAYGAIIKKAVLDVVVAVVAASTVDSDITMQHIVAMLEVEEPEDAVRQMKLAMLRKMVGDATADIADPLVEETFLRRMKMMEDAIG